MEQRPPNQIPQHILDELQRKQAEGSQPQYPDGKLIPDDEGAVSMAVGIKDGRVIVAFPHPVTWFALTAEGSKHLGQELINRAVMVERENAPPFTHRKGEET